MIDKQLFILVQMNMDHRSFNIKIIFTVSGQCCTSVKTKRKQMYDVIFVNYFGIFLMTHKKKRQKNGKKRKRKSGGLIMKGRCRKAEFLHGDRKSSYEKHMKDLLDLNQL